MTELAYLPPCIANLKSGRTWNDFKNLITKPLDEKSWQEIKNFSLDHPTVVLATAVSFIVLALLASSLSLLILAIAVSSPLILQKMQFYML